jgi:hypothetical protein
VDLGHRLVCRILRFLPCLAHHLLFAAVCRNWLHVSHRILPGAQLPWLLLPSSSAAGKEPCFFCLLCKTTHRAALHDDVRSARYCGSFLQGWLMLAPQQACRYVLHNLHIGWRISIPEVLRTPGPVDGHRMVIHAAQAGRPARDADCKMIYVAAIAAWSASSIAFWRIKTDRLAPHPHGLDSLGEVLPCGGSIADMVYYIGHGLDGFHLLTDDEEVLVYVPGRAPDGALTTCLVAYHFPTHQVTPSAITRYLVKYAGELLMVARLVTPEGLTRAFRVCKLVPGLPPEHGANHGVRVASWVPMHVIPSGIIVLGRSCSRSYPTYGIDFDGVYFLDDTTSSQDAVTRALEPAATRKYPSSDMGWLPLLEHKIQRIYPKWLPSESSRAVWFFP